MATLRKGIEEYLEGAGHGMALAGRTLVALPHLWRRRREVLQQLYLSSVKVVHVVLLVGAFAGMILALQTGLALAEFGQQDRIGTIVAAAMVREMGPFITAVILAAAIGSSLAAEIGTMAVSEEITALEVMSIDPVPFLVLPRVLALTIACPLLTVFANAVGIAGGGVISASLVHVDPVLYRESAYEALRTPATLVPIPKDLYVGLFKATVFGFLIAIIGCSQGLRARGGALGVGAAARSAVRNSVILILISGFVITRAIYA